MADLTGQDDMTKRTCSIEGCAETVKSRGWCRAHYMAWFRHGDPLWQRPEPATRCSVKNCPAGHLARGWCTRHYRAWRVYGDPLGTAPARPVRLCGFDGCGRRHEFRGFCEAHARQSKAGVELHPIGPANGGQRRYVFDEGYFDEISDERRAYWLGFITADGCVLHRGNRRILVVELKDSDSTHLEALKADMAANQPLHRSRGCAKVMFFSTRLAAALDAVGIGPRKSASVAPWNGPEHLMPHYWRGLFDGDGSVSKSRTDRKWSLSIVGSEQCVGTFARFASDVCGSKAVPRAGTSSGEWWTWAVRGTHAPRALAEALYGNAAVSLDRKQQLAEELISSTF